MDRLMSMSVFVKVVAQHSFVAAAQELGLSRAAVSKRVLALEKSLGVRLLNRNTRRLSLTEIGAVVYERYTRILEDIGEVERSAGALQTSPRGVLRITAPASFGIPHLAPAIAAYMAQYPEVTIDIVLNDRWVDLIDEGFDVAVRIGHLGDSTLIARRIASIRFALCAAPAYLARRGVPQRPADLSGHDCLEYSYRQTGSEWHFTAPDGTQESVRVGCRLKANNPQLLHEAALNGEGIEYNPTFIVGPDVAAGHLAALLPSYTPVETELSVVYPPARQLSAKVRSFVDFLAARFAGKPEWDCWNEPPRRQTSANNAATLPQ
jgi:DNA-binding transcriptional LysR family regulator